MTINIKKAQKFSALHFLFDYFKVIFLISFGFLIVILSRGILTKNENKIVTFLILKVAKASKIAKIEFGCFSSYSTPLDN